MFPLQLDNFTIAVSVALLVFSIVAAILTPFFRFKKREQNSPESAESPAQQLPALSIVLTPFDDIDGIRKHLPLLLQQDYAAPFQIIIVLEQGDHDGEAVIAWLEQEHKKQYPASKATVYVTYIPRSSRYVSRKKLAITLGVKAVKTEWVILTESYCKPASNRWLTVIAQQFTGENRLVVGYGNYTDDAPSGWRFEKLYRSYYGMREISKGTAYKDLAHNLAFRKEDFMKNDGFLGNLEHMRGEYDFLVNKFATLGHAALVSDEAAWMFEEDATPKRHLTDQLYYLETRKALERSNSHRALYNLDQTMLHLMFWVDLGAMACGAMTHNIVLLVAAVVSWLALLIIRMVLAKKALNHFNESISAFAALWHEFGQVWHSLRYKLSFRMADRLDFTTHKL